MTDRILDSFATRRTLQVGQRQLTYFSLPELFEHTGGDLGQCPVVFRLLLENLLRNEDGVRVSRGDIEALVRAADGTRTEREIAFFPARVVLQDFTGVPAVVDFAAMRDAMATLGGEPERINPLFPSDLVIDHSVQVDHYGTLEALTRNVDKEYERNGERYQLLRWAQRSLANFNVIPPSVGIIHQVNLEHLARVVFERQGVAYPDTLVGTDSHTTMINGIGVLGWGVGGIEAEAAMLGQPINLLIPEVLGVRLLGTLAPGATATDLVLTIAQLLRAEGVVGKFVEFFGDGLDSLPLADRATISNMCPEFGSTCALFPVDEETIRYLRLTGRDEAQVQMVEAYARAQGLFRLSGAPAPRYDKVLELDLASVVPTIAGPRRPHDRVALTQAHRAWKAVVGELAQAAAKKGADGSAPVADLEATSKVRVAEREFVLRHGSVVIAAITSCTNTSNPHVMMAAGLVARNAAKRGLTAQPWVKTSLAPGSRVVTRYLERAGLLESLQAIGFYVVGYGCTTCIGNSGPLPEPISEAIHRSRLVAVSVLSGNRNFEGRISPDVRANYLASPPLVVAYALAGRIDIDFESEPVGVDPQGKPVYLRDLWPSPAEIRDAVVAQVGPELFCSEYQAHVGGDDSWRSLPVPEGTQFSWDPKSTYVRRPTFFDDIGPSPSPVTDLVDARALAVLQDFVTTDHISPAGNIATDSPAARYLIEHGVSPRNFNSYGSRRGNHEVMMRGTFANVRLRNLLVPGVEGGFTRHLPTGDVMSIFDAAMRYAEQGTPLLVIAGKEYGSGSSRDWAAKGTRMLGVRAVVAESFERIHRSNLIGMGVLPIQFLPGQSRTSLGLSGEEFFDIRGLERDLAPGATVTLSVRRPDGTTAAFQARARIDTLVELEYYRHGGILNYVLRELRGAQSAS